VRPLHPTDEVLVTVKKGAAAMGESVHALARRTGKSNAPGCPDCHGAHDIAGPRDAVSRVCGANIPATCGACHSEAYRRYQRSVHGKAAAGGASDSAVCTDCHGVHGRLLPKNDPASSIYPLRIPRNLRRCHDSPQLVKRCGMAPARLATYRESYHGTAAKFGDLSVAQCVSCHGAHDILPSIAPTPGRIALIWPPLAASAIPGPRKISPARRPPDASPKLDALTYWVRLGYRIFITLVMAQFLGLIALDLLARRRERRRRGDPR